MSRLLAHLAATAAAAVAVLSIAPIAAAADAVVSISTPMPPPEWALLERNVLRANAAACREFYERYFDQRGYLMCVERWGGDDGPDDAIECLADWPLLHALGADDEVLAMYKKGWEGHLRQYTQAKTVDVDFARDGMYYREFPVTFDWLHNGEGITAFNWQGLSDPHDESFGQRVRRFAGFYTGEDPTAANYDPRHKIIRSLFNGSRGPLLRKATGLDWAGDPIQIEGRFQPRHGERTYAQMVAHFKDYNDIVGDHPLNLCATSLAANAFFLTHEPKYKSWLLEYVDAWVERMKANGGVIPTNIGLDGKIGGACGGRWYGGVYGWAFSVEVPQTGQIAHRNIHYNGLVGFGNALLLSGDQRYVDVWRRQIDAVNAQGRSIDGRMMYPRMHGDKGWYDFAPEMYSHGAIEVYYWSMDRADLDRLPKDGWIGYLEGRDPEFPAKALRHDLESIRGNVQAIRADASTPDTRLADDPLMVTPAAVASLVNLTMGGLYPGHTGSPLHSRLRYFDPARRRAGLPEDVAALVEKLTADHVTVTLVNVNAVEPRSVIVQGGAYGEHQCESVAVDGAAAATIGERSFTVRLAPGAGGRLAIKMKRYANQPTLAQPWD
jgi:hypothetical protein